MGKKFNVMGFVSEYFSWKGGWILKAVSALLLSSPMSGLSANICCGAFQENMLWFLSKSSRGKMLCILLVKHVFSIGVLKIIQSNPTMIKHTLKIIESHSWSINKILALFSEQNLRSALWECLLWLTQRWQCLHTSDWRKTFCNSTQEQQYNKFYNTNI